MKDRATTKLKRSYDLKAGVFDEFPSLTSAKFAWRQAWVEAGYRRHRNGEWRKKGHPVVMEPW